MQDLIDEETQTLFAWQTAAKSEASKIPVDGVLSVNLDDSALLSLTLTAPVVQDVKPPHTVLVTVVDRSGSMKPFWASQVVPALHSLAQIAWNHEDTMTSHIITYATTTSNVSLASRNVFEVRPVTTPLPPPFSPLIFAQFHLS